MAAFSCAWTRTNRWPPGASAQPTATRTIRSYGSGTTRRHKNGIRRTSPSRGSSPACLTGMSRPDYFDVDVTSRGKDAADDGRPGEVEFMNTGRDSNHAAVTRRTFLGAAVASAALATRSALARPHATPHTRTRARGDRLGARPATGDRSAGDPGQGAGRVARHGSSRARRRLRSDQVRAESAADRQALRDQQTRGE